MAYALDKNGFTVRQFIAHHTEVALEVARNLKNKPQVLESEQLDEVDADVVLIATGDDKIAEIAKSLPKTQHQTVLLHLSGSRSSSMLSPAKSSGYLIGSVHPLVSISDAVSGAERFAGAYFCLEGEPEAVKFGTEFVEALGGKSFTISSDAKPLYHAAAVTSSGNLVALIDFAYEMLRECGLDVETAKQILLPLVFSTIENLKTRSTAAALTGPFARGDVETVEAHINAIGEKCAPDVKEIYLKLAIRSVKLAMESGLSRDRAKMILELLNR